MPITTAAAPSHQQPQQHPSVPPATSSNGLITTRYCVYSRSTTMCFWPSCWSTYHILFHVVPPTTPRRAALSLTAATILGTPLAVAPAPARAATEAFCGVLDYVPSWAFTLPWTETVTTLSNNSRVWIREVGQEPTSGFLGMGKKGAAEYVVVEWHDVVEGCWFGHVAGLLINKWCA